MHGRRVSFKLVSECSDSRQLEREVPAKPNSSAQSTQQSLTDGGAPDYTNRY